MPPSVQSSELDNSACIQAREMMIERRFRIFPVQKFSEEPSIRNWKSKATTQASKIDHWFATDFWGCNYGMPLDGRISLTIHYWGDIDVASTRSNLESEFGPLGNTFTIQSGNGSQAFVFANPISGLRIRSAELAERVTVQADDGFIVGPGSIHSSGKRCEIVDDAAIAPAPSWLVAALVEASKPKGDRLGK